jgi:PPM family protein phosphatase
MKIEFNSFTNVGPRSSNDDRLLEPLGTTETKLIVAIADGIGGAAGGGEAANIAINKISEAGPVPAKFSEVFSSIVDTIRAQAISSPNLAKMGTTLSAAAIVENRIFVAHVGDTRIYHLRKRGLNTLTQDQTEIAELVRKGVFTDSQARRYPRRHVLLSALSAEAEFEIYYNEALLQEKDRIILLSDGVHQRVTRREILRMSLENPNINMLVNAIERKVAEAKPSDNYTLLAIEILEL